MKDNHCKDCKHTHKRESGEIICTLVTAGWWRYDVSEMKNKHCFERKGIHISFFGWIVIWLIVIKIIERVLVI